VVAEVRRVLADVGCRAERKTRVKVRELEQTLGGRVDELCPDVPGGAMLRSLSARGLALVIVATMLEQDDPRTLLEAGARRRFRDAVGERAATVIPGAIRAVGASARTELPRRAALRA